MSQSDLETVLDHGDAAPGDEPAGRHEVVEGLLGYLVGLFLAAFITVVAFFIAGTNLVWGPSIPLALVVLAIAQIGVHLVFFIHITTGPDNANNVLALAFGVLIVMLIIVGSLWIMSNLSQNMTPMIRWGRGARRPRAHQRVLLGSSRSCSFVSGPGRQPVLRLGFLGSWPFRSQDPRSCGLGLSCISSALVRSEAFQRVARRDRDASFRA